MLAVLNFAELVAQTLLQSSAKSRYTLLLAESLLNILLKVELGMGKAA